MALIPSRLQARPAVLAALFLTAVSLPAKVVDLVWDELPPLPPPAGQTNQRGVAGPFVGVHGDALIVAGGANFPDKLPWDGGAKIWWNDIWVLEKLSDAKPQWVSDKTFKLPRPMGYGISVSVPGGVICAGGNDAERCYADVFMLSWDARARELRRTPMPPMPEPLSFMAGALVGDTFYVAGGQTTMKGAVPSSVFWALDLSKRNRPDEFKWKVLPSWPGAARILPVAAAQYGARGEEFFLFGGRAQQRGGSTTIFGDAYAFNPKTRTWRMLPNVGDGTASGLKVMAGTATAVDDREVLIFGGDRGTLFLELEAHDLAIADLRKKLATATASAPAASRAAIERKIDEHLRVKRTIYDAHPGFGREVLAFDTQRETWRIVARSPVMLPVTTLAVKYRDAILIPSGEIKPGVRTPRVMRVRPVVR